MQKINEVISLLANIASVIGLGLAIYAFFEPGVVSDYLVRLEEYQEKSLAVTEEIADGTAAIEANTDSTAASASAIFDLIDTPTPHFTLNDNSYMNDQPTLQWVIASTEGKFDGVFINISSDNLPHIAQAGPFILTKTSYVAEEVILNNQINGSQFDVCIKGIRDNQAIHVFRSYKFQGSSALLMSDETSNEPIIQCDEAFL